MIEAMEKGKIKFECSDKALNSGFDWAKKQALSFSHEGDLVGDWCDSALPGRDAFCMRDVSHQASGAHWLGLDSHNKNMLLRFAQGIAESRDFCSFWEITKDYAPAPVDYTSDSDFWYNLPANFDVLDACLRAYLLTGDADYINSYDFNRFYALTMKEFIEKWDTDGDGIPNRRVLNSRRGIPSYDEQKGMEKAAVCSDLIAAQIRASYSYGKILECRNKDGEAFFQNARRLEKHLDTEWWQNESKNFYSAKMSNGEFVSTLGSPHLLAYFGAVRDEEKLGLLLDFIHESSLKNVSVEIMSHYPEIFFKNARRDAGLYWLTRCIDPKLKRRDYPEMSFATVGAYVEGLMGIQADYRNKSVTVHNNLPEAISCAYLMNCPLFGGEIDCIYENGQYRVENRTGEEILVSIL